MGLFTFFNYSRAKSYGTSPNFLHSSKLPGSGFRSLYAVTEADAEAITKAGTAAGFRGTVFSERLEVDVDNYQDAEAVEARLERMGYEFEAYDSGGKGAHFSIGRANIPSHLLPAQDKRWVELHIPEADTSIYTPLHPYRIAGTVHETTGRKKELVASYKGKKLTVPNVERKDVTLSKATPTAGSRSVFDSFRVSSNTVPVKSGHRHAALVRLCYALKEETEVSPDIAHWYVSEVNKLYEEPKSEAELEHIVRSIFGGL